MNRILTATLLAALVALMSLTPTVASATDPTPTTEITFRAAPAGFVAPSVFVVNNEATWLLDPLDQSALTQAPGVAGCHLTVEDRNDDESVDGADALNEAEAAGCIDGWGARDGDESCTDGSPVFVSEVDGLSEVYPATFWIIHQNGQLSSGLCDIALQDGDTLSFVYE